MNYNCSNLLDMRNLQEQVKKAFCYQKLFWPFTVWINNPSDLKNFSNSRPSASNFKSFSQTLEQFFLTVGQNNFGNNIPVFLLELWWTIVGKSTPAIVTPLWSRSHTLDWFWKIYRKFYLLHFDPPLYSFKSILLILLECHV